MSEPQDRLTSDTRPLPRFNRQSIGEDTPSGAGEGESPSAGASAGERTGTGESSQPAPSTAQTQPLIRPGRDFAPETSGRGRESQSRTVVPPPPHRGSGPDQDQIPTPAPRPLVKETRQAGPTAGGAHWSLKGLMALSLVIALTSLALNGLLIYRLMATQRKAAASLDRAIATLDGLGQEGFHYEYHFNRTIPFSGDIPFKQDLVFPFEGTIPIDTTIEVPIDAGLIKTTIPVRVNTSVYVNTSVPISIDETFHVSTTIPVDMTIPIDIKPDDPAIQELIGQVRDWLVELTKLF